MPRKWCAAAVATYRGDPGYQLTVQPKAVYALLWFFTGVMMLFTSGFCFFLLSRYGRATGHGIPLSDGADFGAAFRANTLMPFGLWMVVLVVALFVLAALSIHLSRRYDPLYGETEPYRRRLAATISETVLPHDELTGVVVSTGRFTHDGVTYAVLHLEFDAIADAPLRVNMVAHADATGSVEEGNRVQVRVTESLGLEPVGP